MLIDICTYNLWSWFSVYIDIMLENFRFVFLYVIFWLGTALNLIWWWIIGEIKERWWKRRSIICWLRDLVLIFEWYLVVWSTFGSNIYSIYMNICINVYNFIISLKHRILGYVMIWIICMWVFHQVINVRLQISCLNKVYVYVKHESVWSIIGC